MPSACGNIRGTIFCICKLEVSKFICVNAVMCLYFVAAMDVCIAGLILMETGNDVHRMNITVKKLVGSVYRESEHSFY